MKAIFKEMLRECNFTEMINENNFAFRVPRSQLSALQLSGSTTPQLNSSSNHSSAFLISPLCGSSLNPFPYIHSCQYIPLYAKLSMHFPTHKHLNAS